MVVAIEVAGKVIPVFVVVVAMVVAGAVVPVLVVVMEAMLGFYANHISNVN